MKRVKLGKTGEDVSQFCLGTMMMGSAIDQERSYRILDRFIDEGGNFVDTANCYAWWYGKGECVGDESELLLGEWMKHKGNRKQIFLATKVGARLKDSISIRNEAGEPDWSQLPDAHEFLSPKVIRKGIEDSLRRLQTDYIDLYYAHIDDRVTPMEETLGALNDLVREGKVRYIGCSNFRTWRVERAKNISAAHGWPTYVALQQEYSYLRPKPGVDLGTSVHVDDELLSYLRANDDISLLAYSPLLKGIYEDRAKREAYYNWNLYNTEDSRARLERLTEMAKDLGVTNSQLVLAWLLHHQPRVIPILGVSKLEQLEQSLEVCNIQLTSQQMAALTEATA